MGARKASEELTDASRKTIKFAFRTIQTTVQSVFPSYR